MRKITTALAVAASAITLGMANAVPAQAAVTGVVYNVSTITPAWIRVSTVWPASTASSRVIYSGQYQLGKGFISGWPCYSQWGYRYPAGQWREMTTTGALYLKCKDN